MMEKLLGKSWGVLLGAVMFATAVNAQDLALATSNANSVDQPGKSVQTSSSYQEKTVTGKVLSGDNSEPLPGVNIIIKGTTTGGITDLDGNYSVNVPDDNAALIFSSVGYETIEVAVGNQSVIDITLLPDLTTLSEIVVVGYGTQEKRDVTAAISSLDKEQISKIPTANPVEALKGQVAGVDVMQNGGRPGQYPTVTVRGRRSLAASNEPLYVVDGVPMTSGGGTIYDFNPQDIESMEILKDAAATAIYGSRGANGVILVTTKRGRAGKTVVTYDGYYGTTSPVKEIDFMMDGPTYADMKRESRRVDADGKTGRQAWGDTGSQLQPDDVVFEDPNELESIATGRYQDYVNGSTDPTGLGLDVPFNGVLGKGYQTNHQVSVMGGSDKTQFNMSVGYFKEQGIISNQDYERFTGRLNLDHRISKVFKAGMSTFISVSEQNWGSDATMGEAVNNNPLGMPYFVSDGEVTGLNFLPIADGIRTNPYNELVDGAMIDERDYTRIFSSLYLEADIIDGLKYKLLFGPDLRYRRQGVFQGSETNARRGAEPYARQEHNTETGYTLENLLTYDKTFGDKHDLKLTFLQSIQRQREERQRTDVINLPYATQLWYKFETAGTISRNESYLEERSLASFMGRINYSYAGKYLVQFTYRTDGSSVLADGNKWAAFPGVSVGWRMVDENFMTGSGNWLSELKLRASYGTVGNQSVDPYATAGRLARSLYDWNGANAAGFRLDEIPNPEKAWEISKTIDVGVDFGFFNGRLSGSFDWYQTETTDLLLERFLPITSGYEFIEQNVGSTETKGVELTLGASIIDSDGGFKWNMDVNIAHYKEAITELALKDENGEPLDDIGNAWFIGQPIRVFFDYQKIGIWQANEAVQAQEVDGAYPGEIRVADLSGPNGTPDGIISGEDRTVLGSDVPDVFGGINNRFEFAGFDLSVFFYYRLGHMIDSRLSSDQATMQGRYNNIDVDYWTIDNPTNDYPRPNINQERPQKFETLRYQDGSYWKLRNVTLGYNFPSTIAEKLKMQSLRLYATAQNPWFSAKYETYDPENAGSIGTGDVPSSKLYMVGINFQF